LSDDDLPNDWNIQPLYCLIAKLESGVSVNSEDRACGADEIGMLKTSCVNGGRFDPNENKVVLEATEIRRVELNPRKDSILVSRMNTFDLVGESAYVDNDYSHIFVPDRLWQTVMRDATDTCVKWLSFVVRSPVFRHSVSNAASGTSGSMKNISQPAYLAIRVRVPPTPQQRKIARILTTVDNLIEKTNALIAKYQAIKQGMMHDLFTRGVNSRVNLRPPFDESPELYKQSELGWIPKEWSVANIGILFDKRTEHGREGLPVMSIVMRDGLVERASIDRRVESNLPPQGHALVLNGDIAYNMMRMWQGVLGWALFDCLVSPAYVVMRPKDNIETHFAAYLFSDQRSIQKFRQFSQGVVDDACDFTFGISLKSRLRSLTPVTNRKKSLAE